MKPFNIALVTSRFNETITERLYTGAIQRLEELSFNTSQIQSVWVPGAVEIPLIAQKLAQMDKFEAIVCLGAVILGETAHFDYVCQQVSQGTQSVALTYNLPVIFGILTTQTAQQAIARSGGEKGHKGIEAIDCAVEMVKLSYQLDQEIPITLDEPELYAIEG